MREERSEDLAWGSLSSRSVDGKVTREDERRYPEVVPYVSPVCDVRLSQMSRARRVNPGESPERGDAERSQRGCHILGVERVPI
jgi:hypothetical protein